MLPLERLLSNLRLNSSGLKPLLLTPCKNVPELQVRTNFRDFIKTKPGGSIQYRRVIHWPEKYTIKPIKYTNLGGRHPTNGMRIVKTLGGGIKWPFLWCDENRRVSPEESPLVEKVLEIVVDKTKTGHLALVGQGDKLRYILATENMKAGDLITSSCELTRNAVRPNEGDAYPVGSLATGTIVCNVEIYPGSGGTFARAAGTFLTINRVIGDKVVIQRPSKFEYLIDKRCIAVVGRVSNKEHIDVDIGTAQGIRHLGYRPRSGLWQRKTGKHGRKIRRPPPPIELKEKYVPNRIKLTLPDEFPYQLTEGKDKFGNW